MLWWFCSACEPRLRGSGPLEVDSSSGPLFVNLTILFSWTICAGGKNAISIQACLDACLSLPKLPNSCHWDARTYLLSYNIHTRYVKSLGTCRGSLSATRAVLGADSTREGGLAACEVNAQHNSQVRARKARLLQLTCFRI